MYVMRIKYARFRNEPFLTVRDIRAAVLQFVNDGRYYELLNWHGRGVPPVVYSKPWDSYSLVYSASFELLNYTAGEIRRKLIWLKNKRIAVKEAEVFSVEWSVKKVTDLYILYHTRTEVITAVNDTEWAINTAVRSRGNIANLENDVLKNIFTRTIRHTYREWFGFEPDMTDLEIRIVDGRHILDYGYKDNMRFPAWRGYFLSNYVLPRFVGYKIGLGKGEIIRKAEIPARKAYRLTA